MSDANHPGPTGAPPEALKAGTAARVIEMQFNPGAGAIVFAIEDALGVRSVHTVHVIEPTGSEADVRAAVAARLAEADARAEKVRAAFVRHGWPGN